LNLTRMKRKQKKLTNALMGGLLGNITLRCNFTQASWVITKGKTWSMQEIPDSVECWNPNCQNRLDPRIDKAVIEDDTPSELIQRYHTPQYPYFTVQCYRCNHIIVYAPWEKK